MTPSVTVSVLIPCYNGEAYLGDTLESVLRQTHVPHEIIVVDDGSTDRSREIAGRFGERVTLVANPGRGASAARNHAASVATGEFFQYLDADDLLEAHALSSRLETLSGHRADVAVSDWVRLERRGADDGWQPVRTESGRLPTPDLPADLLIFRGFWAPPAAILYRRSICERIGGWRETLPIIQDARFLLDAARVGGRFVHVPGAGARYRKHSAGSLSTGQPARFSWDILRNAFEVEQLWQAAGRLDGAHRAALTDAYSMSARTGLFEDRRLFDEGLEHLKRFPEYRLPQALRAVAWLRPLIGYAAARGVVRRLQRVRLARGMS